MSGDNLSEVASQFEVRKTAESHFSWLRTRFGLERTLLAWERTAVSLLGFGFTIAKFFEYLDETPGVKPSMVEHAPRLFGLTLIASSALVLLVSFFQYIWSIKYLRSPPFDAIAPGHALKMHTPALAVCVVLFLVSVGTFLAVVTRAF